MHEDIVDFVKKWNIKYPVDFWWRRKYKIPFNSKKHRRHSLLDMKIEFEEDRLYDAQIGEMVRSESKEGYIPGRGMLFEKGDQEVVMTEAQVDEVFDNIDINTIEEDGNDIII